MLTRLNEGTALVDVLSAIEDPDSLAMTGRYNDGVVLEVERDSACVGFIVAVPARLDFCASHTHPAAVTVQESKVRSQSVSRNRKAAEETRTQRSCSESV